MSVRLLVIILAVGVTYLLARGFGFSALVWIAMCLVAEYILRRNR